MNSTLRSILIAAAVVAGLAGAAQAIQPGTTGTEKRYQQMGLRIGVPVMVNNTATATAGAATLNNAGSGIITTESLTTAAGTEYTLTLTNNMIAAADIVVASVRNGTNNIATPFVTSATAAAGSAVFKVRNGNASVALNGTLKISFVVIKQSALNAD